MRIKIVPTIIALALSALFAYGLFTFGNNAEQKLLISVFGGVSLLLTLGTVLGVSLDKKRVSANIKTLSAIFALVVIVAGIVFSCYACQSMNLIILVSSGILLLWVLLIYFIATAKMNE